MDKSLLNINLLNERLFIIRNSINEMNKLAKLSIEEFLADTRNYASCETFLRHSLEAIFDIGRHILAKLASTLELEYKSIARKLGEMGIISKDFSERLIPIAGYRNRIVHFYHKITPEELYGIIQNDILDLEEFIKQINHFLETNNI